MPSWLRLLHRLNPAVPRKWLLVLAGMLWTGVGMMLCSLAYGWLTATPSTGMVELGIFGIGLSIVVYRFGFLKVARENIKRIRGGKDRACLFSFQAWRSYLLIAVMITVGVMLRNSVLPKPYLAVLYTSIGGGLFLSSFHYYTQFFPEAWARESR